MWHPRSQSHRTTYSRPRSLPYSHWNRRTKCPPPSNDPDKAHTSWQGYAPWLSALLRKSPEDTLEGLRPPPWPLPSFTERNATVTWKSASHDLTVKTNRILALCPRSVLAGVVKPYMVSTMAPSSALCRSILISIANLRVFHSALHTGSDTWKEYGMHTFPLAILKQLAANTEAKWLVPFSPPPVGGETITTIGVIPKNCSIRFGAHRDSIYNTSQVTR